jgi:hypothetical protein
MAFVGRGNLNIASNESVVVKEEPEEDESEVLQEE